MELFVWLGEKVDHKPEKLFFDQLIVHGVSGQSDGTDDNVYLMEFLDKKIKVG